MKKHKWKELNKSDFFYKEIKKILENYYLLTLQDIVDILEKKLRRREKKLRRKKCLFDEQDIYRRLITSKAKKYNLYFKRIKDPHYKKCKITVAYIKY